MDKDSSAAAKNDDNGAGESLEKICKFFRLLMYSETENKGESP